MRLTSTGRIYFVDHTTRTTSWDDPRLPANLYDNAPQYKRDYRRKVVYFRSQPAMRQLNGKCEIKLRRTRVLEDSYAMVMKTTSEDLKKRLMVSFVGEDGLDFGGVSRLVLLTVGEGTPALIHRRFAENGSSCYLMRYSIPLMDCSSTLLMTTILCKSTLLLASIQTISHTSNSLDDAWDLPFSTGDSWMPTLFQVSTK
jgi:WW domain